MNCKQIVFTKLNTAELLDMEIPALGDHDVLVETAYTTISCGTERANITGDIASIDADRDVPAQFPRMVGYSGSGVVSQVGKSVTTLKPGDRVAMSGTFHKKFNLINENAVIKISDNISLQEAALIYIGVFPIAAVRKTQLELGESAMVMGLGILGLLSVQFARAAGATPVIAVDPVPERREKALLYGADYALDPFEPGFVDTVKSLTDGGVNAAIEVTGVGAGLNQCLDCMKKFGRVALLGCTRSSEFSVDYYRKVHGPGITLIGAHTAARPQQESHPHYFTVRDDMISIYKLTSCGRINLKAMLDTSYSPLDCAAVYTDLIHNRHFPTVAQFDWSAV